MSLEDKIIKKLNSSFLKSNKNLVGIGDDCAYLGKEDLLISTDTFIENTHFDLKKSNPKQVAKKFFNANYSDLQSSGGRPLYCFLNISFSKTKSEFIHHFIKELTSILKKYKIILMGGDTTKSITDISLTMTLIGKPFNKRIFLRTNAKEEELICTFSNIGFSKLGYDILYKSKKIKDLRLKKQSIEQFLSPKVYSYAAFLTKLKISSCMDLSDGLIIDLIKYSQMSKKRFHLNNLGNLNPTLYKKLNKQDYYNYVLTSGEEFVPIFTIPSNKLVSAVDYFKKNLKVTIVNIGSVLKGSGVTTDEYNLDKIHSFSHFN